MLLLRAKSERLLFFSPNGAWNICENACVCEPGQSSTTCCVNDLFCLPDQEEKGSWMLVCVLCESHMCVLLKAEPCLSRVCD